MILLHRSVGSFRCSPGCQQSQLSPVSCSPREAEARSWWEEPGSSSPSLKRFWIAWGFQDWNSSTWRQKVAQQQHGHGLPKARRQSAEDMVWIILIQSTLQYIQLKTLCWIHTACRGPGLTWNSLSWGKAGWATLSWARALKRASLFKSNTHRREKVQLKFN